MSLSPAVRLPKSRNFCKHEPYLGSVRYDLVACIGPRVPYINRKATVSISQTLGTEPGSASALNHAGYRLVIVLNCHDHD